VEDAEQPLLLLRQLDQRLRLGQIQGERLVDHHVLARQQGLASDGAWVSLGVAITTRSRRVIGQHLLQGADPGAGQRGLYLGGIPAHHPAQGQARGRGQEGGVKGLSCEAVSHQGGVDCVAHPVFSTGL
jgi:hypothetical protein